MPVEKMIFSYFSFFTFFASVAMGIIGLKLDPKGGINRAFAVFSFIVSIWAFGDIFYYLAADCETACFWYRFTAISWCGIFFGAFYFYTEFTGYLKKSRVLKAVVLLYTVFLIIMEINEPLTLYPSPYGYIEDIDFLAPGFFLLHAPLFILVAGGTVLVIRRMVATPSRRIKKMMTVFLVIGGLTYLSGVLLNILQNILNRPIPPFGSFFMIVFIAGVLFLMKKYRLMRIDYRMLQNETFDILSDFIFILSPERKIIDINITAKKAVKEKEDDISSLFSDKNELEGLFRTDVSEQGKSNPKYMLVKGKNGESIPTHVSLRRVFDDFKDHIGTILIAKPLTDFEKIADENSISRRERSIILCLVEGLLNKEISARLNISESTVKNHITNIYQKTNTINKVELIRLFFLHEI